MHFGTPVVPDENMMYSGAETAGARIRGSGTGCANNAAKSRDPVGSGACAAGFVRITTVVRTLGNRAATSANRPVQSNHLPA